MHDTLIKEWTMDEPHEALRECTATVATVDCAFCLLMHFRGMLQQGGRQEATGLDQKHGVG